MDITKLTPEERAALKAQLEAEERAEKQKRDDDIKAYKVLVAEFVHKTKDSMMHLSGLMRQRKDEVFDNVAVLVEMKEKLYNTKAQ